MIQIIDATARTGLIERIVVQRVADWIVVAIDEPARGRVDDVRHFVGGQDFIRHRLVGLRVLHRQPLIAAGAAADEKRWQTGHHTGLQILAHRHVTAGEMSDVPMYIGVGQVQRTDVEELKAVAEITEVLRLVPNQERVQFARRAEAGVLNAQGGAIGGIQFDNRTVVSARHD